MEDIKNMEYKQLKEVNLASNIGNRVFVKFMARDVDVRTQKDGKTKYITLNMCDRDVCIDAKRFGASESEIELMKNGAIYRGAIDIKEYAKSPNGYSCIIYNFEVCEDPINQYVEWTTGIEQAVKVIQETLNELNEGVYGQLATNIILPLWNKFSVWTAASSNHHNALGGLLVHTAEVIEQSQQIGELWEEKYGPSFIDRHLLLAASLLHDIGKTSELDVDVTSGTTSYSTEAALDTHITIGVSIIDIEAYKIGLGNKDNSEQWAEDMKSDEQLENEKEALRLLKHCILSHHGQKEWGSPITPNCPEATILHMADRISAEMFRYNKTFSKMKPGTAVTEWVGGSMVTTYKDSNK